MIVFSQYSSKPLRLFQKCREYDHYYTHYDLYTSIQCGNGLIASRIAYANADADVFTDVKVPVDRKLGDQIVLVGRSFGDDDLLLFHQGFDYDALTDADIEDMTFEPYTMPKISLSSAPVETPSLYRNYAGHPDLPGLPLYPINSYFPKSLFVLENVRASDIDPLCKIGRVFYRDWDVLNEVYKKISARGTYIHHGTYRKSKFKNYPHNMLCHDLMITLDVHGNVEDVFQVDMFLLCNIANSTVYK